MSPSGRRWLWGMIAVALGVRLVIAFATEGVYFDIESMRLIGAELDDRPLQIYGLLNDQPGVEGYEVTRWPYGPVFFLWIAVAWVVDEASPLAFHGLVSVPSIAADVAIAWCVQHFLGLRGAGERARLAGAGLVLLGPAFAVVSGYSGQIDSVAIAPAALALVVWSTPGFGRRALWAGLLIGLGAAIKTPPLLMLLALLPSARSPREAVTLVAAAVAVPAAALAPFFVADPTGAATILGYGGGPGQGGLSLLVQPALAGEWLTSEPLHLSSASETLYDNSSLVALPALAATGVFLLWSRPAPVDATVVLWLAVYTFLPNFFPNYIVWGLPFFIMAGHLRKVGLLQLLCVVPALMLYTKPWPDETIAFVYVPLMVALFMVWVVALALLVRRIVISRRKHPTGVLQPLSEPPVLART